VKVVLLLFKDTIGDYMMTGLSIYALKLENGKYYVGRSYNVPKRLNQHYDGEGSVWTKKHKPIRLNEVFLNKTKFDEDKYTLMYMSIYGIENVRGGSFCSIELGGADKYIIKRMICNATDKCVKCEQFGHFFTECPLNKKRFANAKTDENDDEPLSQATDITEPDTPEDDANESYESSGVSISEVDGDETVDDETASSITDVEETKPATIPETPIMTRSQRKKRKLMT
tara:strand:+ start:1690 stop:2373 length:684 start_codon:yes stop_codon:yes gene_type:complete